MKKSLLFSAAALMLAGTMTAQTFNVETVWSYDVKNKVANPVPGLDGGWTGWNASNAETKEATATCSRFGVGLNGKILTTDHKKNAIIAIDKDGVTTFKELNPRTADRWNGTLVTTDDAGNVIINYNFTDKVGSAQKWGIIDTKGNLQEIDCSSSLANQGATGRVDVMGHIVGDVTSTKGAAGYVVSQGSGQVIMMTFMGDGTKCIDVNCKKAYGNTLGALQALADKPADNQLTSACPRFSTIEALNASTEPAPSEGFIIPLGVIGNGITNCPSIEDGWVGKFVPGWSPAAPAMGNRYYQGIAYFELGGKSYVVRNYVSDEFAAAHMKDETTSVYSKWKAVMNFAVYEYDVKAGTARIAAEWMESEYSNGFGMGTLSAEVVDDTTVNIYTWASTGSAEPESGTTAGIYCAMVKLTVNDTPEMLGDGTEANPYQVTAPGHIEAMKDLVSKEKTTYFKLMNDIDMTGINHIPTVGSDAKTYGFTINFDGNNHVISNLTSLAPNGEFSYASLFGVFQGKVKNLGLVDVNLKSNLGVAGIGGYVGYGGVDGVVENCYVTGKMESITDYAGGLMGTTSATATFTNCYAQVEVTGKTFAGGLVGRGRETVTLNNCYVSGTVAGEGKVNLLATTDKTSGVTLNVNKVVVVNTGAEGMTNYGTMISGAVSTNIADVATWDAFNEGKTFNELPALNWQENAEAGTVGDGTEANPYEIATAADLANMWTLMKEGAVTYFVQTADINMSQIDTYTAPNGYNGKYARAINYDGKNHIISNFAPATRPATEDNGYYCTTLFGVVAGKIANLGVVDAACINPTLEGGILGGFGGGSWVADVATTLDNVFVTGVVTGNNACNGGFFGMGVAPVVMTNCYAQVKVAATGENSQAGGIYANASDLTISNSYFSGTVTGTKANLVANGTVKATNVYAFGEGTAVEGATVVPAGDATAIAAIKGWAAFNEGKLFNDLPALNWQNVEASGIDEVVAEENADAPVEYYNLQGIRVENPANGLYIKKQGNKATKVLVR